ncbi:LacI family DNA-binding transcriptional regulator [Microbacterium sp. GXF0217]
MVTSHEVARLAGVSQSSVSRVLRGANNVDPDIREKVQRALETLSYVPNASAKAMRTARTGAVGVVASEILNPYFPTLVDAITRAAAEKDLSVLLWNDADPDAPLARQGVASGAVDGVIFAAARQDTRAIAEFARRNVPLLLISRADPTLAVDQVTSDHEESGYRAAAYLLAHGRTDIATMFGPRDTFASPARERGFRRRLDESGIAVPDEHWMVGETTYDHGWVSARRLIDSGQVPSALFCSADLIAIGAMSAFRQSGVRIPEDVWVMGHDGLPMAEWSAFDLTTQRQQVDALATAGIELLSERMSGSAREARQIALPTEMVVRSSTAFAPA